MRKRTEVCVECNINKPDKGRICEKCRYQKRKVYCKKRNKEYYQTHKEYFRLKKQEYTSKQQRKRGIIKDRNDNSEYELVWLAGFIDGEGCLSIYKGSGKRKIKKKAQQHYIRISIINTGYRTIERISNILNKYKIKYFIQETVRKNPNHNNTKCVILHHSIQVEKLLNLVQPYLFSKQKEAQLIRKYIKLRREKGMSTSRLGDEEFEIIDQLQKCKKSHER